MIKNIFLVFICFMISTSTLASPMITDDFAESSLEHLSLPKPHDFHKDAIEDEVVDKVLKPTYQKVIPVSIRNDIVVDEFASKIDRKKIHKIRIKNKYNFAKPIIEIELKTVQNISTKKGLKEGDTILFKTIKNIKLGKEMLLPKGSEILGRVETISPNDLLGTPEDVVIENFVVKDNPNINLYGAIRKRGADRSWWLYPIYQAGNIAFWAAGYPLVMVRGGRVRISNKDVFTVYYENQ